MTSSTCFGAGIVAVGCYKNDLSILMLSFGLMGMLLTLIMYLIKLLPVNSPLP